MDRWATKDRYEHEQSEAERLVRPAPKDKPPRRDKRRETVDTERDPDLVDRDNKDDKSLNYKDVGATALLVAARFVIAKKEKELITVRKKDTGKATQVTEETLKGPDGNKYEVIEDGEGDDDRPSEDDHEEAPEGREKPSEGKGEEAVEGPEGMRPEILQGARNALKAIAKDPKAKQFAEALLTPGDQFYQMAHPGDPKRIVPIPENQRERFWGAKSFTEAAEIAAAMKDVEKWDKKQKKQKGPAAPKKKSKPAPEEDRKPSIEHDDTVPGDTLAPSTKRPSGDTDQGKAPAEDFDPDKTNPGRPAPLPPKEDAAKDFDPDKTNPGRPAPLPPKEDQEEDFDPEKTKPGKPQPLNKEKKTKAPSQEAKPPKPYDPGKGAQDVEKFLAHDGLESKAFLDFVDKSKDITLDKDGKPVFYNAEEKKRVHFDDLDTRAQSQIVERFEQEKHVNGLRTLERENPKLKSILQDLANPKSDLSERLSQDRSSGEHLIEKAIPELKGVWLPERFSTIDDLTDVAKKLHPPIPEPKRREFEPEEQELIARHMLESIPSDKRDLQTLVFIHKLKQMHPDDMQEGFNAFQAARHAPLRADTLNNFTQSSRSFFETDPEKVKPPEFHIDEKGKKVPFSDLPPEQQAEVYQKHKVHTVALSLANKHRLGDFLERAGTPNDLANALSTAMLEGHEGETAKERANRLTAEAKTTFENVIDAGEPREISEGKVKRILEALKDDPAARRIAVGYLQANDYLRATKLFRDPNKGLSEHSSPREIAQALTEASNELNGRDNLYGDTVHSPARLFRERVIDRLKLLSPEKVTAVRKQLRNYEDKEYERKYKAFQKAEKEYSKKYKDAEPYRSPPRPEPPTKPEGYRGKDDPSLSTGERQKLLEQQLERMGLSKTAARVGARFKLYSSYPSSWSMGEPTTPQSREAVYHGIAPYPKGQEGFAAYVPWTQAHQSDVSEKDFKVILTSAKSWLATPVLSKNIEGIVRDTQLRAALDLAIRDVADGRYSAGFHPETYNMLLARLAGEGGEGTLLTIREAGASTSPYARTEKEETSMKLTDKLTAFASKLASSNPEMAYDLVALAREAADQQQADEQQKQAGKIPEAFKENIEKMKEKAKEKKEDGDDKDKKAAEQQQSEEQQKQASSYAALKSLVIRTASADPLARQHLLPVLQLIKQQG